MKQVIITFTRHKLSDDQMKAAIIRGAADKGVQPAKMEDVKIIDLSQDAKRDLQTDQQVKEVGSSILHWTLKNINPPFGNKTSDVLGIFGVFPPMLLEYLSENYCTKKVNLYSAWNISRTPEGGKATFHFKRWCKLPLK